MTPDTQQARAGHRRPQGKRRDAGAAMRVVPVAAEAARTGRREGAARPAHASRRERAERVTSRQGDAVSLRGGGRAETRGHAGHARRAQEDTSIVGVVPLLSVLVVAVAGVYIAWRQGSVGGSGGGVVAGCALLAAAAVRLLLPAGLCGLLAVRKRSTDVCTLAAFGIGLLVVGLILPR
jgi:Protein of unknown function (DUF3017)